MAGLIRGRVLVSGEASGSLLLSSQPLSFWGGYDQKTGDIIDSRHPLGGRNAVGTILAIPFTVGSSTTTAVLLEAIRGDKAPAGILTQRADSFLALASIVADEMYRKAIPIVALSEADFAGLANGQFVRIFCDGRVQLGETS